MFVIEVIDQLIKWIAIRALGVCAAGARRRDEVGRYVAEIQASFGVSRAGTGHDLAEDRRHVCSGFVRKLPVLWLSSLVCALHRLLNDRL